ncbi:hypothetical protein QAD02_001160 [Eretmocerus hayati]|uniref:Uncharacterized protein n=1 Tax=Eretmocerus hayati TaxID=131215 RepID=A0ACC2NG64_9HYME|nr:hypothetical protein QAD02_001160 [Eretmocerus hayati]
MPAIDHTFFDMNVPCLISTFNYMDEHDFDDSKLNSDKDLLDLVIHGMLFTEDIPFIAQSFKKFVLSIGGVAAFRSKPMYEYSIHAVAAVYFMTMETRCRKTASLRTMNQSQAAKIYGDLFNISVGSRSVEARIVRRICRSPRTNYCIEYYECNHLHEDIEPDEAQRVVSLLKEKIKTLVAIESTPANINALGENYLCKSAPSKMPKTHGHEPYRSSTTSQSKTHPLVTIKDESVLDELRNMVRKTSANLSPAADNEDSAAKNQEAVKKPSETPPTTSTPHSDLDENVIACISSGNYS